MRASSFFRAARLLPMAFVASCDVGSPSSPAPGFPLEFAAFYAPAADYAFPRTELVIRTETEWETLWPTLESRRSPKSGAPTVDFNTETVVLASTGTQGSGGHSIEILEVSTSGTLLRVRVRTTSPGRDCATTAALVNPVVLARVPRWDGEVEFVRSHRVREC
jgi:hypothetical protein